MAITTMDQLVAGFSGAQFIDTYEASLTTQAAGNFCSLWKAGGRPGAGGTPSTGSGDVPTNATAGALPYVNPGSGTGYLGRVALNGTTAGAFLLHDRLVETSGLSGTSITAQTVNSTAITRTYGSGIDTGCWIEVYTALGSTAATATISYTNQSSTSGRSGTISIPATAKVGSMYPMSLQSGDTGVLSVQTVTLSISTGTAGNFGITLMQRICQIPLILGNTGIVLDYAGLGLPVIQNNACLFPVILATATSTGIFVAEYTFISG